MPLINSTIMLPRRVGQIFPMGLRRIEWVIFGLKTRERWGSLRRSLDPQTAMHQWSPCRSMQAACETRCLAQIICVSARFLSPSPEIHLVHLFHKSPRLPQHVRNFAPARDGFSRIVSVLESILVTLGGAWGEPAVHPAAAVRHRWRPAPAPAPCPRSTSRAAVHGQFASHGVVPPISLHPLPPGSRPCPPPPARQHAHGRAQP